MTDSKPSPKDQIPFAPRAGFLAVVPAPPPKFNRWKVQEGILQSDLPPLARLVALVLLSHANRKGECFPGVPRLMHETALARASVFRELNRLEARGYVTRRARYGSHGRRSNIYCLDPLEGFCPACGIWPFPENSGACAGCGMDFRKQGGSHTGTHRGLTQRPLTDHLEQTSKVNSAGKVQVYV